MVSPPFQSSSLLHLSIWVTPPSSLRPLLTQRQRNLLSFPRPPSRVSPRPLNQLSSRAEKNSVPLRAMLPMREWVRVERVLFRHHLPSIPSLSGANVRVFHAQFSRSSPFKGELKRRVRKSELVKVIPASEASCGIGSRGCHFMSDIRYLLPGGCTGIGLRHEARSRSMP